MEGGPSAEGGDGGGGGEDLLQKVMAFCIGNSFEQDFEAFAEKNKAVFLPSLDMDEKAEHPLEFHDVYLDYLRKFEAKIERFIDSIGYSTAEFYKQARLLLENDSLDGDSDSAVRFFLEALLATSEYPNFVSLMKGEMIKYRDDPPSASAAGGEDGKEGDYRAEAKSSHK